MNADVDIWSYEGYAVYALENRHILTAGGEYRDEEREGTVFNQAGTPETREVDYTAFYLQDEWQLTDSLNMTFWRSSRRHFQRVRIKPPSKSAR